ncbi:MULTISPECIES: hypothetical protein [unclassified Streptomyces]|uniref:hypothetical protein n=1 Tax=unclassified Streptomyces TaxID=2593676 RepID=UPI002E2C147D|nr:hypothetical protein [Streptomyces sp. NBC_00273]
MPLRVWTVMVSSRGPGGVEVGLVEDRRGDGFRQDPGGENVVVGGLGFPQREAEVEARERSSVPRWRVVSFVSIRSWTKP